MKVTAVIMECNPFHGGHEYILKKAREETGCDFLLVIMSGNYVQRGEPALFPTGIRARAVLEGGADLVLELPLPWASGSAEYFARGAVSLLEHLGVADTLCFGSETGDAGALCEAACLLAEEDAAFKAVLTEGLKKGLSYPAARSLALSGKGLEAFAAAGSNDLLAAEYLKALLSMKSSVKPLAVKRIPAPSATDLRRAVLSGEREDLPESVKRSLALLSSARPASPDLFSGPLLHALWQTSALPGRLCDFPDIGPDLENRIRSLLPSYESFSSFCALLKTRNVTYTRISRCMLRLLLGLEKKNLAGWQEGGFAGYARVLGFKKEASPLLRAISENSDIPLVTRLSSPPDLAPLWQDLLSLEIRAGLLYRLMTEKERPVRTEYEQALLVI